LPPRPFGTRFFVSGNLPHQPSRAIAPYIGEFSTHNACALCLTDEAARWGRRSTDKLSNLFVRDCGGPDIFIRRWLDREFAKNFIPWDPHVLEGARADPADLAAHPDA
jgi:hypothetical protein